MPVLFIAGFTGSGNGAKSRIHHPHTSMKTALFTNISNKPFTGYWNGKPKTFKPGEKIYLEEGIAKHYAKHLTNQMLLEKDLETCTSPKFPEQVPQFMEIFNQCCIVEKEERTEQEVSMEVLNRNHPAQPTQVPTVVDNQPVQVVVSPDADEDEETKEFPGLN